MFDNVRWSTRSRASDATAEVLPRSFVGGKLALSGLASCWIVLLPGVREQILHRLFTPA